MACVESEGGASICGGQRGGLTPEWAGGGRVGEGGREVRQVQGGQGAVVLPAEVESGGEDQGPDRVVHTHLHKDRTHTHTHTHTHKTGVCVCVPL